MFDTTPISALRKRNPDTVIGVTNTATERIGRVGVGRVGVGRVGALAFALGVGWAIGSNAGVAYADSGAAGEASSAAATSARSQRVAAVVDTRHNVPRPTGNPATPKQPAASAIEALGLARREAQKPQSAANAVTQTIGGKFFAATPVIAYNAAQNVQADDGAITGNLNASQANGYSLTYTASNPQHGTVVVHSNGTFTYTPDESFVELGGTDTFTVTADDEPGNPPHWHGLRTIFAPNGGATATASVTVLENPGPEQPTSVLATTDQLNAEELATRIANSPVMQLAKVVLRIGWWFAARHNFSAVGGPDQSNMDQLDHAITEYANQAAMEVQLLNSNSPKVIQQVSPHHDWYMQSFSGTRIWYDNPDTIYRFIGVNSASSYVITGKFDGSTPADTNISVLTGLNGTTAANINGRDLVVNPDGTFTITADSSPAEPGEVNHLQLVPGTTLITTRNTLSDWNTQEPMSLSVLKVSGPPSSLFSQIGGFAIPGIGPLVAGSPVLTALVSVIPPLPGHVVQSVEAALIMLLLGINGENQYMSVATTDAETGQKKPPNVLSDPDHNASFLATQLQSAGYFQIEDDEALVITIDPGKARYFSVPVTNDWTITNNYWDEQTSLNVSQSVVNPNGTYTYVVSPTDPGVANWVSTGGLNQGTISIRFQDFNPESDVDPTVHSELVPLNQLDTVLPGTTVYVTPEERQEQIAQRQLGYNKRYAPYPQA